MEGMTTTDSVNGPSIRPFRIAIPQTDVDELAARVVATRLPRVLGDGSDETGFPTAAAHDLLVHWQQRFDWRRVEARLDELDHVLVRDSGGQDLHVVRARTGDPGRLPVVLLHGWPDSFLRYRHLLSPLTAAGHDVYVPSLPGFGFSDQPAGPATVETAADAVGAALQALGVTRYAVHGGDWGSAVAEQLARTRPDAVAAVHLTDVPWQHAFTVERSGLSPAENSFLDEAGSWAAQAAYLTVQSTQATTLALALADSPMGLAAWVAEKYATWSDQPLDHDEVLAQVCLTWFTRTEHSGMRYYSALGGSWDEETTGDTGTTGDAAADGWVDSGGDGWEPEAIDQPVALAVFPADILTPPREYAQRVFPTLTRFTAMPRGGHFAALEQPELLATDIAAFLSGLR